MIFYNEKSKTFYLESANLSYVFRVNEYGFLEHLYYGKRIPREDLDYSVYYPFRGHDCNFPSAPRDRSPSVAANECPTFGRGDYRESMLAFDFDGVRVGDLIYDGHEILNAKPEIKNMPSLKNGGQTLAVRLKDGFNGVEVRLFWSVYEELPVIARRVEITNISEKSFKIDRAYSFCVDMPDCKWQTISLHGAHLRERFIDRSNLSHGAFSIDSKRGVSSGQTNPFIALVRENTTEKSGEAFGYNLIYSGDFVFKAQVEQNEEVRLLGGINDYDFSWELAPEQTFFAPEAVLVYSDSGLGGMSRAFHDLYRDYLINERYVRAVRPVVINNWEATYFDFDTEKLCDIIQSVKGTGIDTFVLDDGWFGLRNDDKRALGDWFVNEQKVDMKKVADFAHENDMKFGLWFEPEMINENSDLFRAHPDWIISVDGLQPCTGRDQLVLDLTRKDVRDYVVKAVSDILNAYPIDYVKWDMNRALTENYSRTLAKNAKETHHRYVLGVYDICARIVNGFPHVFFEGCASGGCRFDPAMLYYFPQIWTSDDSDAYMRTIIQYGTSMCYPLSAQSCHVSVCPNHQSGRVTPFNSRAAIAHLGATGYELDTTKLSADDLKQISEQVREYKQIENLILCGDLYRLNNPLEENLFAEMVVSKDKEFAYLTAMLPVFVPNGKIIRVFPQGLDEDKKYLVSGVENPVSGGVLMNVGLVIKDFWGDFSCKTIKFEAVK